MNKFLASLLGFLNGFMAMSFVIIGMLIGNLMLVDETINAPLNFNAGFLFGGFMGLMVALIVCGALAVLIDMRNELIRIRMGLNKISSDG